MTSGNIVKLGPPFQGYYETKKIRTWNGADRSDTGGIESFHHYSTRVYEETAGTVKYKYGTRDLYNGIYELGKPTKPDIYWDNNDENALISKLFAKVKGHDFNAGLFLGTAHQTYSLIASRVLQIRRALKAAKRLDASAVARELKVSPKKAKRITNIRKRRKREKDFNKRYAPGEYDRKVSSLWLEYSYGWAPLFQDVYEATHALANRKQKSLTKTFKASRGKHEEILNTGLDVDTTSNRHYKRTLVLIMEPPDSFGELALLGLTNPTAILWELMPWSFAIDWFLPIGSYLDNISVARALTGRSYALTKDTWNGTISAGPGNLFFDPATPGVLKEIVFTRGNMEGVPVPPVPSFKNPFSASARALNQIALLAQLRPHR